MMASGIRPMMPSQQPMMTAMGGSGPVGGMIRPAANQQLDPFGAL